MVSVGLRPATTPWRSRKRVLVGEVAVTSGTNWIFARRSPTNRRVESPGMLAMQIGSLKVTPGRASTVWKAVAGGAVGIANSGFVTRSELLRVTVTVAVE